MKKGSIRAWFCCHYDSTNMMCMRVCVVRVCCAIGVASLSVCVMCVCCACDVHVRVLL